MDAVERHPFFLFLFSFLVFLLPFFAGFHELGKECPGRLIQHIKQAQTPLSQIP